MNRVLDAASEIPTAPLDPTKIVQGAPLAGFRLLAEVGGAEVGVWEMTPGIATDVEVDEVFAVLSGSATVTFDDGERVELVPGSIVRLRKHERTTWAVHATLRKLYVA
ncbi:cupin domain-containing protein [Kribbella speibonae]|uniref:cupin domain-containing protein n=1 Tax=Kribbella speibonae TaxID=1572660 RepID=UPI001EE07558|nr:cupin domain-containing protein [Kribbella speibonae]